MKAVVKKRFRDKYTDEVYEAGSELELTSERYAEIRDTDKTLVVAVAEELEPEKQTEGQQGTEELEPEKQTEGQQGTEELEPEKQTEGQQGTEEPEPENQTAEVAGQKPKRTKKQAKQDE